jgi:oligopeptide/dipeptide ABC transporter ATP-binding protein
MLEVKNLSVAFRMGNQDSKFVPVTAGIEFSLEAGATLGVVGESGSGKSVTSMAVMGLLPKRSAQVTADKLVFNGKNLLTLPPREWQNLRGREIAMIFQDPMTSLNPLMRCGEQISEAIRFHQGKGRGEAKLASISLLEQMGIPNPERRYRAYPFELSGGMRQRVMIAIALACRPKLLIADEPTTALDVTIQAQILTLIRDLQKTYGMALMLITHDLGIVQDMVQELMVMYAGSVVEKGRASQILKTPTHPYTLGLLKSIPSLDRKVLRLASIEGVVPKPTEIVPGCRFHPRCFMTEEACKQKMPALEGDRIQSSACIRRSELLKTGEAIKW